jgi:hypothetical protein
VSQSSSGGPPPRDRDDAGRPRNSRPRDDLGRPLGADAPRAVPRADGPVASPAAASPAGSPATSPVVSPAASLAASPAEAASAGGTLLLEGRPFHAHEVFEDAWKVASGPERDLWRGLAQVAVGLTHARRGNPRGAVSLLRRGAERLRDYTANTAHPAGPSHPGPQPSSREHPGPAQAPVPYGIDVTHVASRAAELATRIERDGLDALPPEAFLLSLGPA